MTFPTEQAECEQLALWLKSKKYKFTHVPNETFTKSWSQKLKNKRAGVSKGFPDYVILVRDCCVFIEMKKQKGGTVSKEQKEWIEALGKNHFAKVCKGFEEAKAYVLQVLEINRQIKAEE